MDPFDDRLRTLMRSTLPEPRDPAPLEHLQHRRARRQRRARKRATGAVAVVVAVVAGAAVVATRQGSDPVTTPAPTVPEPTVTTSVAAGPDPTTVTSTPPNSMIDNVVVGPRAISPQPDATLVVDTHTTGLVVGHGSVWLGWRPRIIDGRLEEPGRYEVWRLDPETLAIQARIPLPPDDGGYFAPHILVLGLDDVWVGHVGDGGEPISAIFRIDVESNIVFAAAQANAEDLADLTGPVPGIDLMEDQLIDLAVGQGSAWVVQGGEVEPDLVRLDPETLQPVDRFALRPAPHRVVVTDDAVWIGVGSTVQRLDPVTGAVTMTVPLPGPPVQLLVDGQNLLALHYASGVVTTIDTLTGAATSVASGLHDARSLGASAGMIVAGSEAGLVLLGSDAPPVGNRVSAVALSPSGDVVYAIESTVELGHLTRRSLTGG